MLCGLASLEAEYAHHHGEFYVWVIVDRAYALSPDMQGRQQNRIEAHAAREAATRRLAEEGDDRARLYLALSRSLWRGRPGPRTRCTTPFWLTEGRFNPSRVLASLETRGLVRRTAIKGGGSAGLTDAGRQMAASLSVGTTSPPLPATETVASPEMADV
ncbi:hypothetical protein FV219_02460 [Methylobacterium sp. WL122]|nr:hypothetical protein FV219_02460 [Methylobacterium sp. WL122]